jgi:hypothetical protein
MQIVWAIKSMIPGAKLSDFDVTIWGDGNWEITRWELPNNKPSNEEVESYWNANHQTIVNTNKPPMSDLDKIKKNHTDLVFSLMTKGVL